MDQLSKDAVAAQKAGMTYGKYMAMKERLAQEKELKAKPLPQLPEKSIVCAWCGKEFKKRSKSKQIYCAPYCQQESAKARARRRKEEQNAGRT